MQQTLPQTPKPMKTHAQVVIIGGGIAGVSTLYHLTQLGCCDAVLIERDELTSGSTWHAAAQVTQFAANQTMFALKRHSIDLYRELAADRDFPIDYHLSGGMRLAHNQSQVDLYKHFIGVAGGMNIEMEYIDAAEAGKRHPLLNTAGMLGAWWDPLDGDIDPAQLVFALARRARQAGAVIYRYNPVFNITRLANGEFMVHTQNGVITCEKVVNAAGYRVNEVGKMLGTVHPVTSMEHMYCLTEPIPQLQAMALRVPIIRDPGADFYSRQEKHGLLIGVYEQGCKTFGMHGIDPHFTKALCPADLDRCLDNMQRIFARLPCLTTAGIHSVINGPITYTIDGAPLVGPIPGITNAYACLGLRAGIGEGGGLGKILAELIVHGECEWDAWYLDPRRFTQYANTEHTCLKAVEDYRNEFHYSLPQEHRPAARLARTTPLYAALAQQNAVFGVVNGWERVLCFKPNDDFIDETGFHFTPTQAVIAAEVRALSDGKGGGKGGEVGGGVGLMEVSGFNRYSIQGKGAGAFLDKLICGKLPRKGKVRLCYLLTAKGNVLAEATIAKLGDEHYWYGSAAAAEWHDRDWLRQHLPAGADGAAADSPADSAISISEMAAAQTTLVLAGPKSRALLQAVSPRGDWSAAAFPYMHAKPMFIGHAQVLAMRVSFSGELAYELHVPNEQLYLAWQTLQQGGAAYGLSQFGLYAAESMRLEKGYRHWKADLTYEYNPIESGLARFCNLDKPDFIGKQALLAQIKRGNRKLFAGMEIACDSAPAHHGDPVFAAGDGDSDGAQIGSITSAGYGHRLQKNLAYAFIEPHYATAGTALAVGILGGRYAAVVTAGCLYDPLNIKVKS